MLDLLNALSRNELVALDKFLCSPYYNQNTRIVELCRFLELKLKSGELEEPTHEEIFAAAYGKEQYNDVKYRKLVSEFTGLFEKFLSVRRFENKKYLHDVNLLEELDQRKLDRLFESQAKNLLKKLNKSISRDDEYYSANSDLHILLIYYYYNKDADRTAELLQVKSDNIDLDFIFKKLHSSHEMMLYNEFQSVKREFSFYFYDEIIRYIRTNKQYIKDHHPNLYVIFLTILMYKDDGDKYSSEFLEYLNILKDNFPKEKLTYYYSYITSFYWNRINKGNQQYRKSLFDTYKKMVKEDMLFFDKYLSDNMFNSIIMIGISQKEFDWTEKFIEKYKNKVEPSKAKDAVNLAYAKIFFYKKKFDDVISFLKNVEFKNTIYFTNAKFLLSMLYFERQELTALNYVLDSLTHYVRRNKQIIAEQVLIINTFIKYMKQLIRYMEMRKKDAVILKMELDNEKNYVPNKNWFYEKVSELGDSVSI